MNNQTLKHHPATLAIHTGEGEDAHHAHNAPIYMTSSYGFESVEDAEARWLGDKPGYVYTRRGNPTLTLLQRKLAVLEGLALLRQGTDVRAVTFSSGMAAISASVLALVGTGDHLIAQDVLYGTAHNFFARIMPRFGVGFSQVEANDPQALEDQFAAHPDARILYLETPANPNLKVVDIALAAEIAHRHGAMVLVDNTFATPVLQRPLELGADVVIHSTTKYLSGHGLILGGAVISRHPDYIDERLRPMLGNLGSVASPFDAWLTTLGVKTLHLRVARASENALTLARWLAGHPAVARVMYPGLEDFPGHEIAARQMQGGFGGVLSFELKGGLDAGRRLMDAVQLCTLAFSLGNMDTLIEHPATMTHSALTPEERAAASISDGLVRLAVGLEDVVDIQADLEQALNGAQIRADVRG